MVIGMGVPRNMHFLTPPVKRQRSFSTAELSVVCPSVLLSVCLSSTFHLKVDFSKMVVGGVKYSLKILISQKRPDNFFSFFLVYSFLRKVGLPMYSKHMDLVESS